MRPAWDDWSRINRSIDGRYPTRRERLDMLWAYYTGNAPLPQVADEYTDIFRAVMRKARCNYAPKPVSAISDRMSFEGVETAADSDADADDLAADIAETSNFAALFKDFLSFLLTMSEAYLMVVPSASESSQTPLVTALDPRYCVGEPDPMNPTVLRAGLYRTFDPVENVERAQLFLPGVRFVATRGVGRISKSFTSAEWTWEREDDAGNPIGEPVSGIDGLGGIPIVRFDNKDHQGEFEAHIDLLDRINDTTLQRIVLTWYQSFRQRAVIGDLEPDEDVAGATESETDADEEIDWNAVFRADPGALWRVPEGVKFWESQQADLQPILTAKRDDVKEFATATETPMYLVMPDAANQSAEGASSMREGLVFKVKDRRARCTPGLKQVFRIAFAFAGQPERARGIRILWGEIESNSISDKANATAQAKGSLSLRRILTEIWGFSPDEVKQNMQELIAEAMLLPAQQATQQSAQPPARPAA